MNFLFKPLAVARPRAAGAARADAPVVTGVVHAGGVHETAGFWFRSVQPLSSATWTVSAVPEPGQYAMLLFGIGALASVRRRPARRRPAG